MRVSRNTWETSARAGESRSITMSPCQSHQGEKCQWADSRRSPPWAMSCPALPCLMVALGGRWRVREGRRYRLPSPILLLRKCGVMGKAIGGIHTLFFKNQWLYMP